MSSPQRPSGEPELVTWVGDPLADPQGSTSQARPADEWWPGFKDRWERATRADAYSEEASELLAERREVLETVLELPQGPRQMTGLFAWGPYWIVLTVEQRAAGEVEPVNLEIRSYPTASGRLAPIEQVRTLRALRLAPMVAKMREQYMANLMAVPQTARHVEGSDPEAVRRAEEAERLLPGADRSYLRESTGPKGLPDEHFRRVADVYSAAPPRSRTRAVAEWGRVSESTASKWISRARTLRFLPPTESGVPIAKPLDETGEGK